MADVAAQKGKQPGAWVDPYQARNFRLDIGGITSGRFTEVIGLGVKVDRIAYREAGSNSIVRAIPGRVTYPPVMLRSGLTSSTELWDWMLSAVNGRVNRRNASIVMLDTAGVTEVLTWNLLNAWPQEWTCPPLDAMSSELAIATLVLAHEGLELEAGGGASRSA